MGDTSFVKLSCSRIVGFACAALMLASCDDGYSGGQEMATIHHILMFDEHWEGVNEQQVFEKCDFVAVIPKRSYTLQRLLKYTQSDVSSRFDDQQVRIRIDMGDYVVLIDHSGNVKEPGKPIRMMDWPQMYAFEELFYKIKPPQRQPCKAGE